jgi:hypothetical protein
VSDGNIRRVGQVTDEEDVEMMELQVAVGAQERYFDSEAGEERYRPVRKVT